MFQSILVAGILAVSAADLELQRRVEAAPKDISAFVDRRANCNHFLGEEPYDKARAAELNKAIRQLRCAAESRDESRLRRKYSSKPDVLKLLDETADLLGWPLTPPATAVSPVPPGS